VKRKVIIRWREAEGLLMGTLGVLGFSLTLPATRAAVPELGGTVVGLGRAIVAALLAALLLLALRERPLLGATGLDLLW
jgi:hypothetical protein